MKKFKLKSGDLVKVVAGANKGAEGKIVKILTKTDRAIVEGVNMVSKHVKPSAQNPQGGISKFEAPIHISNLMLLENGKVTRVGFRKDGDNKVRYSKKSNEVI
ncbi:MAG TPA: 50S ribosomal protein L24 [Flavobacteriia bacterium]|nr:50S ribosomal protein L24 [Flavobacteriia bacterium]